MTPISADLTFEEMTDEQREQYAFLVAGTVLRKLTPDVQGCLVVVLGKGIMAAGAAGRKDCDRAATFAQLGSAVSMVQANIESQKWGEDRSFESGDEE